MFLASSKDLNFKENKDNENDPPNLGHGGERETQEVRGIINSLILMGNEREADEITDSKGRNEGFCQKIDCYLGLFR